MTTVAVATAADLNDALSRAEKGERVLIRRAGKEVAVLVPLRDLLVLEEAEERWTLIVHGDRLFRLWEPLSVRVGLAEGVWTHACDPIGILGYGSSRAESLDAFRMEFAACWDLYAQEDDANLTQDARDTKRQLLALVEAVESVS